MRILKFVTAWCVISTVLWGCRAGGSFANECSVPGNDEDAVRVEFAEYVDTTDCLNGYYIVSDEWRSGVVDAGGRIVMPMQYGNLFFLEDDVIAGFTGDARHFADVDGEEMLGRWHFLDTDGNVLGETSGALNDDPESLLTKFCEIQMAQERVWEEIVYGYERFCERCAANGADFGDMKTVADSLREEMRFADGRPGEGQRRRIEQAYGKYLGGRKGL